MSEKDFPIRSISRALSVLQAINRHGALTITEAARAANIPYPTACRIIQTLIHEGMIEREETRKCYRATALSQSLSCGYQASSRLIGVARPHMVALTTETSWPVSIATRVGASMVIQDSTHALTTQTFSEYYPGFSLPIAGCATGQVYLAHCRSESRNEILAHLTKTSEDSDSGELGFLGQFEDEFFDKIVETGYATFMRNQYTKDPGKTSSIAVPILLGEDVIGAMALVYFSSALKPRDAIEKYVEPIQAAQKAISADLEAHAQYREA